MGKLTDSNNCASNKDETYYAECEEDGASSLLITGMLVWYYEGVWEVALTGKEEDEDDIGA
jgi:hypothetical protein